ncbi:MAG: DUF4296 domain-containing protein [Prevotellaceae bacterium]|jgi:hypothetical protein|nr:DUF4296 domain-containing protein [Prevotellaceae bacterium]
MLRVRNMVFPVALAVCLSGCQMRPTNVMRSSKMVDVLCDIHLTEATIQTRIPSAANATKQSYHDAIFEKYGITRSDFDRSITWYARHPYKLAEVYAEVQARMETLVQEVGDYKYHPEAKLIAAADSLDTIPLFSFAPQYLFHELPVNDTLQFETDQTHYFAVGDVIVWRFLQRMSPLDSLPDRADSIVARLWVSYEDGHTDSLSSPVYADTLTRRYTFRMPTGRTLKPVKVKGAFYVGTMDFKRLQIDSASLTRIYNHHRYPLPDSIRRKADALLPVKQTKPMPQALKLLENSNRELLKSPLHTNDTSRRASGSR